MAKTIIFLGAGAAKADGAPIQSELFAAFVESVKHPESVDQKAWLPHKERVFRFFKDFFGIDLDAVKQEEIKDIEFPTFEEALGVLDLAIMKEESYRNCADDIRRVRTSLVYSMAKGIKHWLDHRDSDKSWRHHEDLIEVLKDDLKKKDTVIITTNYDLLADNAILSKGFTCDYGIECSKIHLKKSIRLLKIHGSLNWLYCPVCGKINISNGRKSMVDVVANLNRATCSCECETPMKEILVPPTFYKNMENRYLKDVYECAERELLSAEKVIFCGYSFPDADMHVKYLMKRAEQNGLRDGKPLEIVVYNGERTKSKAAPFERFFKDKQNVSVTGKGFDGLIGDLRKTKQRESMNADSSMEPLQINAEAHNKLLMNNV